MRSPIPKLLQSVPEQNSPSVSTTLLTDEEAVPLNSMESLNSMDWIPLNSMAPDFYLEDPVICRFPSGFTIELES
jgi:hypothetical protein